jgi:transcriptional regulator with XRE-family HTH domain
LVKSNNFLLSFYDASYMGRKPKTRRDPYGAWLLHLRKESGLTQDEISAKTGVPQSTWAYWERTGKFVGRETIIKTAKALGVSVQTLLRLEK